MKTFHYPILGIAILITISSCGSGGNQAGSEPSSTYVPKYDRLVRSNIEKVRTEPWDKNNYVEIRDNQIPKMKGRKKQTESMKLLKLYACLSMEKELKGLLESQCTKTSYSKNHTKMTALYNELTGNEFKDVVTGDSLHARADYKTHKDLFEKVGRQYVTAKVSSLDDAYDMSYDSGVRAELSRLYANAGNKRIADRCHYLKNGMTNVSFRTRHKSYCEAIVSLYEKTADSWSESVENSVQSRLRPFQNEFKNTPDWGGWMNRIVAVKEKFAQQQ